MPDAPDDYLIWSHKHAAWWAAGRSGYTPHLAEAGRYTRTDAMQICVKAIPGAWCLGGLLPQLPVRLSDLTEMHRQYRATYPDLPVEHWE